MSFLVTSTTDSPQKRQRLNEQSSCSHDVSCGYTAGTTSYPKDARGTETTECRVPFKEIHLKRLA